MTAEEIRTLVEAEESRLRTGAEDFQRRHNEIIALLNATDQKIKQEQTLKAPQMWTLKQASENTGLSYDYLRKFCLQGKIVYVRAGSKYLLNASRLIEYLNTGEKATG